MKPIELKLPPETINPISGLTRAQEISAGLSSGGRLPFDAYLSLIRRGVVPYPATGQKKETAQPARKKKNTNKKNTNKSVNDFTTFTAYLQSKE